MNIQKGKKRLSDVDKRVQDFNSIIKRNDCLPSISSAYGRLERLRRVH
ncbi:hypothetical protein AZE42_11500 [Rhizopogon vesiculosus]|uniref:Uncharacterized protein n=1 Tax=Rhizopogon vesiculosus TaxID=180088 RepID=A0A1J8QEV6_9AGAM|nr:hypothetical protein AZE42_11500 [Rhizopogon vesiculosus]